jgi:hypothetical protein
VAFDHTYGLSVALCEVLHRAFGQGLYGHFDDSFVRKRVDDRDVYALAASREWSRSISSWMRFSSPCRRPGAAPRRVGRSPTRGAEPDEPRRDRW